MSDTRTRLLAALSEAIPRPEDNARTFEVTGPAGTVRVDLPPPSAGADGGYHVWHAVNCPNVKLGHGPCASSAKVRGPMWADDPDAWTGKTCFERWTADRAQPAPCGNEWHRLQRSLRAYACPDCRAIPGDGYACQHRLGGALFNHDPRTCPDADPSCIPPAPAEEKP